MAYRIVRDDITKIKADAIVNSANPEPTFMAGTDSAVYMAAGAEKLLEERKKIGIIKEGEVAVTPAFALDAKYIFHTVGPVWEGGGKGESETVRKCYLNCLNKAVEMGLSSIAFPLISTGVYGFPKAEALQIAVSVFGSFLLENELDVTLAVFDSETFTLTGRLFAGVEQFIDDNYVEDKLDEEYSHEGAGAFMAKGVPDILNFVGAAEILADEAAAEDEGVRASEESPKPEVESASDEAESASDEPKSDDEPGTGKKHHAKAPGNMPPGRLFGTRRKMLREDSCAMAASCGLGEGGSVPAPQKAPAPRSLEDVVKNVSETWTEMLLRLIREKGYEETEVYKRANVDRKHFSKIRSNKDYQPKKHTVVAFALALRLNLDETKDFLARAGYALSPSSKFDLIVEYYITINEYSLSTINSVLFSYDQPLLG